MKPQTPHDPAQPATGSGGTEETSGNPGTPTRARKAPASVAERLQTLTGALQALALALVALAAVFAAVPALRHAATSAFDTRPAASSPAAATSRSTGQAVSSAGPVPGASSAAAPSGCPKETASYYVTPVTAPGASAYSLGFCAVDVNDGQEIGRSYTLSGKVTGSLPAGMSLAIISEPDPSTCDEAGNPGNGEFYFQEEINSAVNDGVWQLTEGESYPGSETIRHNVYFVAGSKAALQSIRSTASEVFPPGLIKLAYITVQGKIPPGHSCPQAG